MKKKKYKNITATIEARMSSSRLPGKVLLEVNNKPLLHYLVARLQSVKSINTICLATTNNTSDDVLEKFAKTEKISIFRGNEEDVMGRVIEAGKSVNADLIVEITGDCPLIDPTLVEQAIQIYINNNVDYVNNNSVKSYPDGMDVRIFELETLIKSYKLTNSRLDKEHVALHIKKNPQIFSFINIIAPPNLFYPHLGLTLDETADYELIKKIIEYFGKKNNLFNCESIITLLNNNPDWLNINKNVKRKGES